MPVKMTSLGTQVTEQVEESMGVNESPSGS